MPTTARRGEGSSSATVVHLAFELGATEWKLGFTTGLGRSPRERVIRAGGVEAVEREVAGDPEGRKRAGSHDGHRDRLGLDPLRAGERGHAGV